jgi:hypothetical protein
MAESGRPRKAELEEDEIVILVPRGSRERVYIEELDPGEAKSEIIVRVSRQRKSLTVPVIGVMVK